MRPAGTSRPGQFGQSGSAGEPWLAESAGDSEERVLFVHAHPDDESITTGGTIATLVDAGATVTVLTCTRGENGEVIPEDLQHLLGDGDALAAHRERELGEAMRILGVTDHRWLGSGDARIVGAAPRRYRDSGMVWGADGPEPPSTLPDDALCAAELGEVAADIATVVATTRATAVVGYDENGGYGHPDHVFAHRAARRAADTMKVPFFAIDPTGTSARSERRVDATTVLARKIAALRAHRSQLTVEGGRITMSGGQVEPITTVEAFRRLDPHDRADPWSTGSRSPAWSEQSWGELSFGARVAASVLSLLGGATIGALGTINHQIQPVVAGVTAPLGLLVGLVVVSAVLVGLRMIFDTRHLAGFAALGVLGVIGILSLESPGGSVLIPASTLAYYWIYGPVLIAAAVLAWPKLGRPARDKIVVTSETTSEPKGSPAT